MEKERPILLIEDDDNDAILFQRVVKKNAITSPVQWVRNGEEAIHYLDRTGTFSDLPPQPLPISIVVDLRLPRLSGFELLAWLAERPAYRHVPIAVLSGSFFEPDKLLALKMGAQFFMTKSFASSDLDDLFQAIRTQSSCP